MYQVFGTLMPASRSEYSPHLRMICEARSIPALLPPSFPWLAGGLMMWVTSSWKSEISM